MYEVKMDAGVDPLEASFDAVAAEAAVSELRGEMEALRSRMDQAAVVAGRPALAGASAGESGAKAFVEGYLRKGVEQGIELKSFNATTTDAGGYAVPREIDAKIDETLTAISPIRSIANVVKVGTAGYRKLVTSGGTPSGWAGETDARTETATPSFHEIVPSFGELYANPAASQAMLDDAAFDVEGWLAHEIATEFARAEGQAFVAGNGTNKPKGFLTYTTTNESDAVRAFGSLQYVASGAAGGFAASNPQDKLVDLVQALRSPYRQGASWVMNSATLSQIRKFKTNDGAFLWQPGLSEGRADTLLGYPVVESEDMPDVAANSLSIAFGNFSAGYLIAERQETAILRDPFTHKPFVHFYTVAAIELLVQPVVQTLGDNAPPSSPLAGQCWIVGTAPGGGWAGQAGALAMWTDGGWRFTPAFDGTAIWVAGADLWAHHRSGTWALGDERAQSLMIGGVQVVGAQQSPVALPPGGTLVDTEARAGITAIILTLRAHGLIAT